MPDAESFDAFYARTVWRVTSQVHELADNDSLADHAIREAYAKAYQQWYQVSGYRDSEGWVLATATDAYERRRAEAGAEGHVAPAPAGDSGTWPGIYRPRPDAGSRGTGPDLPPADPEATIAPQAADVPAAGAAAADPVAARTAPSRTAPSRTAPAGVTGPVEPGHAGLGRADLASGLTAPPGRRAPIRPGRRAGGGFRRRAGGGFGQPGSRRTVVVAAVALAVLLVAAIAYLASGGHKGTPAANPGASASAVVKPKPHMLAVGKTGRRSAIPWSLVGSGWALAEFSTAQPGSAGTAAGAGRYTTYLVDPEGGKYEITTSSGGTEPQLMAWSGDEREALFGSGGTSTAAAGTGSYSLLKLRSGQLTALQLPAGVAAIGFTRPDGLAILAVRQGPGQFRLQRYTLTGQLQASLASLPRKQGESWPSNGCSSACALSSPDGTFDVWGIAGDEMEVLSNAGGKPDKIRVQDGGHRSSCVPLTWWDDSTILADCGVAGLPDDAAGLWLVPASGSQPTRLTTVGDGPIEGAWLAGQTTYVTSVTSRQCSGATGGAGGLAIERLGQGSSGMVTIPGSTSYVSTVVASLGERLLVLAQTSCPGTSSLLWFSPSTGTAQLAWRVPPNEVGVIAAVPYGNGPAAVTNGQYSSG